ncbi:MAG: protein-L-isoaspartate(D-aspartate) O-methyltransferase [Candidatus Hodarchaeales archaeon]|jgi:protein-L-isoaspartate(D-aspartate) O-methyltransferase
MNNLEKAKMSLYESLKRSMYVKDTRALEAFLKVKREDFLPEEARSMAYVDTPLRLFEGQTISAPHMAVAILEYLQMENGQKILEIGTGSGYQAALLAEMVLPDGVVVTIERIEKLYHFGKANLKRAGYKNVKVFHGDGTLGVPEEAPFDKIILTAAGDQIPPPLIEQLAVNGILCMPLSETALWQTMITIRKTIDGKLTRKNLTSVRFVPLIGKYGVNSS